MTVKNTPILGDELTADEIKALDEKAIELAKKYSTPKVHVFVAIVPETKERIIGFLKEPSYIQKLAVMDKIHAEMMFIASEELRGVLTLQEESDPRTYSTANECDKYRLGMAATCIGMIEATKNEFK